MNALYRLIPTLDTGSMGSAHYLFDRMAETHSVFCVPTQKISPQLVEVIQSIRRSIPAEQPRPLAFIESLFSSPGDLKRVRMLLSSGYLEQYDPVAADATTLGESVDFVQASLVHFQRSVLKHYLKRRSFFNLPHQVDDAEVDVGLIGVPISSVATSAGTVFGPERLRQNSQNAGFWFDFHKSGIYTEVGCDGSSPELICRSIVAKDFGNIGADSRTVGELFNDIGKFIESTVVPNDIRPVFFGGDHAITFPVVTAFLKHYPSLVLLHLDAHNDVFYTEKVEFSHASPVQGLLLQSNLSAVYSFGLRTNADPRVGPFQRFSELSPGSRTVMDRLHMHSLNATRRRLSDAGAFSRYLIDQIGAHTPCYLSIDLDVLSESALNGQLSTPAGTGLSFQDVYEFIRLAAGGLNIVGADIVEFSINGDTTSGLAQRELTTLSMHLIEGLHQSSLRNRKVMPGKETAVVADALANDARTDFRGQNPGREADAPAGAVVASAAAETVDAAGVASGVRRSDAEEIVAHKQTTGAFRPASGQLLHMKQIERRSLRNLTYEDFVHDFVLQGLPVVLTGCTDGHALEKWSLDYFLERIPRQEAISVNVYREPFGHDTMESVPGVLSEILAQMNERQHRALSDNEERYNIVDWAFGHTLPELFNDIPRFPFFDMGINEYLGFGDSALKWIYFGEPGTGSRTHVDVLNSNAWLLLARGCKQWRMVHSREASRCLNGSDWVDLFAPDLSRFPLTRDLEVFETLQMPGEIVWTPSECIHAVRNLDYCIAVTQNYIDLTNIAAVHRALLRGLPYGINSGRKVPALAGMIDTAKKTMKRHGRTDSLAPLLLPLRAYLEQCLSDTGNLQSDLQQSLASIE